MTEQRPEDNEQALTDSGVWVDESSSGLTHEPGVWVDRPAIDPDRLGAMIREQSGVTEHVGDVQEPNVGGGVPQPGSADQIHSLDLSSAYEEATPPNPSFDSAYDQIIPTEPTSPIDSVHDGTPINVIVSNPGGTDEEPPEPPTPINVIVSNPGGTDEEPPEPPYEFEAPVLSPEFEAPVDFESPYGASQEHSGAKIPDLVEQPTPPGPSLQFADTANLHNALGASLFDPATPGPTLDPSLFDSNLPGATLDPSLFDPSAPGPTLDPALLDPNSPGPTFHPNLFDPSSSGESIDPALLDPSAPGPTLDPAQLEHGIVESSGIAEPAGFTNPSLMDAPALTDPGTAGQDDHEHNDFFEGGV
jgi:hypothetical protein